jgi:hypothetical protein
LLAGVFSVFCCYLVSTMSAGAVLILDAPRRARTQLQQRVSHEADGV